jgi:subtilisin-like proprotein convertase family protein
VRRLPLSFSVTALAAVAIFAQSAAAQCQGPFTGGVIPGVGTGGGGVFPGTLPASPSVYTGVVAAPGAGQVLKSVKLNGLSHTWGGDVQMFIESPAQPGVLHSLFCLMPLDPNADWINNSYEIVDPIANPTATPFNQGAGPGLANGIYSQFFNGFAGPANTSNTPLETIAVGAGTWTLHAYDWVGADAGSLTSWELCFGAPAIVPPPPAPTLLTPADTATALNPVTLTWSAVAAASSYDVDLDGVVTNTAATSFAAPTLASGPHTWRVRAKNSGGNSPFTAPFTFTVPVTCAAGTCVTGGLGSAIPGVGAADGVWPTTLPLGPMVSTASITTPAGATALQSVKLLGLTHTWRSDVMVVLTAPNGSQHIIYAEDNTLNCGGTAVQYGGDYTFVDSTSCAPANGNLLTAASPAPTGEYAQAFGGWPSGNAGLNTTPISAIPVAAGTNSWTLTIYDWCTAFDNGGIIGFDLCFAAPAAPIAYCTGGTTTNGCIASISANLNPNAANTTQVAINVANVEGQKQGIYFYGVDNTGFSPVPWSPGSTSFLCVKGPTQRAGSQGSGGTTNACNGAFSLDWDAFVAANPLAVGVPFAAGDKVFVQAWFRDPPAPKTTNLSNAIEMTVQP